MTCKWEPWEDVLKVLEEAGGRKLDPNPSEIIDIINKSRSKQTIDQVRNELFRILKGMTSGDAQAAIVQGMARNVLDVFGRFISKGKSRTKVAVRELRQKINAPRHATDIGDYGAAVVDWDSNLAKLVSYRGQDTLCAEEEFLDAYYHILPPEVMTFAQLRVDEAFEPDGFREEMDKYIYRKIRETKTTKSPLASVVQEVQGRLMNLEGQANEDNKDLETHGEQVQNLRDMFKGNGKKGKGEGKVPNGGKGLCFNCGEAGHFAAQCDKPKKENPEKRIRQRSWKEGQRS